MVIDLVRWEKVRVPIGALFYWCEIGPDLGVSSIEFAPSTFAPS